MNSRSLPKSFITFYEELKSIFGTEPDKQPKLTIVETRREFEKKTGLKETPKWMVGFAKEGEIIVFSQESIEKESTHKREAWGPLVKHEMVHLFYTKRFGTIHPLWLNEGLACLLSGQEKREVPVGMDDIIELHSIEGFMRAKDPYNRAYSLVKRLLGE